MKNKFSYDSTYYNGEEMIFSDDETEAEKLIARVATAGLVLLGLMILAIELIRRYA
jgi:hypothetical protein